MPIPSNFLTLGYGRTPLPVRAWVVSLFTDDLFPAVHSTDTELARESDIKRYHERSDSAQEEARNRARNVLMGLEPGTIGTSVLPANMITAMWRDVQGGGSGSLVTWGAFDGGCYFKMSRGLTDHRPGGTS